MAKEHNFFKMEMLILLILNREDCYGYELATKIKKQSNNIIDMKMGTLYPILYKLTDGGFITSTDKLEERRVKVYYHIEPKGIKLLEQLIKRYDEWTTAIKALMTGGGEFEVR